jgi:hypothetical protein
MQGYICGHLLGKHAFYQAGGKKVNIERYFTFNYCRLLYVYLKHNIKQKVYPYTALRSPLRHQENGDPIISR